MKIVAVLSLALLLGACGNPQERAAEHLREAQDLYEKGDYVAAKLEARNAAQLAPKEARAYYLLALIAERQQDLRSMIANLLMTVSANPRHVTARVKLGTVYFLGNAYEKAAEQAKAAAALAPDNANARLLNARLLFQDQDQAGAIRELDAALGKDPDLVDAIALRATAEALTDPAAGLRRLDESIARLKPEQARPLRQVRIAMLGQMGRQDDVERGYRELARDFPADKALQFELARFYAATRRFDEAEKVLREVVTRDPKDVAAQLGLVRFIGQVRGLKAAEQALDGFVAQIPDEPRLRLALGPLYAGQGRVDDALALYGDVAKRFPKSPASRDARVSAAMVHLGKGGADAARQLIDEVLAEEPDHAEARLVRAQLRVADRKFDEAVADVRAVTRRQPQNTAALLMLARTHALKDENQLAKEAYRQLLAVDPRNTVAPSELAVLEAQDGNFAGAEAVLRARLALIPGDVDASIRLITLLGSRQSWTPAEAEARRLASLPHDGGAGQVELGKLLRAQGRKEEAVAALRQGLEENPASIIVLDGLVTLLAETGRSDEASNILQAFRRQRPDDLGVRFLEGQVLARDGKVIAAAKVFGEIVAAQPDAARVWVALVRLRDDPAARIEEARRALEANPGHTELSLLLASGYEETGRFEDAMATYEQIIAAHPGAEAAVNNLAALLLDHQTDAASYARALELVKPLENSGNPLVLDTVGWAYYRNQRYAEAVEILQPAVADAGDNALLRYHLGMAYLAIDNPGEAEDELRVALSLGKADFPGRAEAQAALAKLGE
jgi:tetratricopeptide (TPR) repeat protein